MQNYLNINFEFDRSSIHDIIDRTIKYKEKGYVCVVDGNVLKIAQEDINYRKIINSSLVNICDGSSITLIIKLIHKKNYSTYTGPEIFNYYIKNSYRQLFLGNTDEVLMQIKAAFEEEKMQTSLMFFSSLPFKKVEEFDYSEIGILIKKFDPQIIWVSLGAPKQEFFINNLLPHIDTGILFAIGAAFNIYLDKDYSIMKKYLQKFHIGWVLRILKEPKRIGVRAWNYLIIIPKIIYKEKQKLKLLKHYETISTKR